VLAASASTLVLLWLTGWTNTVDAALAAIVGAWPVYYLCERLGGRPAPFPRSVDNASVDELSSFWERLLFDSIAVAGAVAALAFMIAGADPIRRAVWLLYTHLGIAA
jgi:hypothetical protein